MILELMLADHNRDCITCEKRRDCELLNQAQRFGVDTVRFETYSMDGTKDMSSPAIIRHPDKCILCGDCIRVCDEIQNVGAMDFVNRGSNMEVMPAFDMPIAENQLCQLRTVFLLYVLQLPSLYEAIFLSFGKCLMMTISSFRLK